MEGEEGETIEFYKIKLMEKDREISNFEAKLKKIQFKHSRDLKESKMSEERASNLLQEEKTKSDKHGKQAKQNQQQNNLLQTRLSELKEDKDKEISDVRAQYNNIKEQIRSYERILPTHTFLSESGLGINQLPTYEDIFLNLKDKVAHLETLNSKFEAYREKKEEQLATVQQNEELLKQKKLEVERNFQEMLPKTLEYEQQTSDLKQSLEHLESELSEVRNQLQIQKSQNESLQEQAKNNDIKIGQISQAFTTEVHNKEEDIKGHYLEEIQRYEQEINQITSRLEIKDNMYLSQITILEEDNALIKARLQEENERGQETLEEAREEISGVKEQYEREKKALEDKTAQNEQNKAFLIEVSRTNEELEEKIKLLEGKIREVVELNDEKRKENELHNEQKLEEIHEKFIELEKTNENLKDEMTNLQEEKDHLSEEITHVKNEFTLNSKGSDDSANKLQVPSNFGQYYEKYRRFSNQLNKSNVSEEQLQYVPVEKQEFVRERTRTLSIIKQNEDYQKEIESFQKHKEELTESNAGLREQLKLQQKQLGELQEEVTTKQNEHKKTQQKLQVVKKEKEKVFSENIALKEKIVAMNKSIYDNQEKVTGSTTKTNLQKTKIQSLEQQNALMSEQLKREKETAKTGKEELKQVKQELYSQAERDLRQIKELKSELQSLKAGREKIKSELVNKEKTGKNDQNNLAKFKEAEEKLRSQLSELQKDFNTLLGRQQEKQKQLSDLGREMEQKSKIIRQLKEHILMKDRENELINDSLDRERRERTIRSVPSLQNLQGEVEAAEEKNFQDLYSVVTQKEGEISFLQREVSDLKEELESLGMRQASKLQSLQAEHNDYIQTIIEMKMKCAQSQMRASEKEHLYNQLKKKFGASMT